MIKKGSLASGGRARLQVVGDDSITGPLGEESDDDDDQEALPHAFRFEEHAEPVLVALVVRVSPEVGYQ